MRKKKLIIIGGKGNGTVLASAVEDVISDGGAWEILGFLNDSHAVGDTIEGFSDYPVLGTPEKASQLNKSDCYFYYALFSAKTTKAQSERLRSLGVPDEKFATIVHPCAHVSQHAQLGYGVTVMPFAYVGDYAQIDNHVYIHGSAYVARNASIHNYGYLASKAYLGAEAALCQGAYLGVAATVLERMSVGEWSVVGAMTLVREDVPPKQVVVGNPLRKIDEIA